MVVWKLPKEALEDPFRPPRQPCDVFCVRCGKHYSSARMRWRRQNGKGAWRCPTHGCVGKGFGYEIFPLSEMHGQSQGESSRHDDSDQQHEIDNGK